MHAGFEAAPTGLDEGADPELAALIDAAGWRRDAISLARGRIHHYTAGATRSVLDALHDGDALSAAYHDLIASGLWRSVLRAVLEDAVGELRRVYTLALRTVCRHPSEDDFERALEALVDALRRTDDAQDQWSARENLAGEGYESAVWTGELQGTDLEVAGVSPEHVMLALTRAPGWHVRVVRAVFQARYEVTGTSIDEAEARYLVAELAAAQREGLLVPATSADTSFQRATSARAHDAKIHAEWLDERVARVVATNSPGPLVLEQWLSERDPAAAARRERDNVARDALIWVALLALRACGLTPQVSPGSDALSGVKVVAWELGMKPPAVAQAWTRARREGRFVLSERHGPATRKRTSKA